MSDHHAHSDRRNNQDDDHHSHSHQPSTRSGLRILIGTANLGHAIPDSASLSAFLPHHGKVHDVIHRSVKHSSIVDGVSKSWNDIDSHGALEIIAIGLQEAAHGNIVTTSGITAKLTGTSIKQRHLFGRALETLSKPIDGMHKQAEIGGTKKLKESIVSHIGDEYALVTEFQRGELVLYIFVRKDLASSCHVDKVCAENVGVGSIMANKCGIAATVTQGTSRLTFICAHLNANEGKSNYEARNSNIEDILAGTNDGSITSHHTFFFGDLNYRCELPKSSMGDALTKGETMIVSQKMITSGEWDKFNEFDELRKALNNKKILSGFETPFCKFPPTFKVEKKEGFHYNLERIPSYTDRILWKSNEETRLLEPIIYEAMPKFTSSDHKPVRGLFFLPSRPSLKLANLEKKVLNLEFSHILCKGLKPEMGLANMDIDTFMRMKCDPPELERKSAGSIYRTETVRTSDRPLWRNVALRYQVNVESKENVLGSFLILESVQENLVAGSSLLGTAAVDLEHIIRKSLGVKERSETLKFDLLRHGKCVGNVTFDLHVGWSDGSPLSQKNQEKYHHSSSGVSYHHSSSGVSHHRSPYDNDKQPNSQTRSRSNERPRDPHSYHHSSSGDSQHHSPSGHDTKPKPQTRSRSHEKSRPVPDPPVRSSAEDNVSEKNVLSYLTRLDLPPVLLSAVLENYHSSDQRLWIIENSNAMQVRDSTLLGDDNESLSVSRWEELSECVCFHSKMNARCGIKTEFKLLNSSSSSPHRFIVGSGKRSVSDEIERARKTMEADARMPPTSPLVECIQSFYKSISSDDVRRLRESGKFINLILATQGVPNTPDGNSDSDSYRALGHALSSLNKLPVKLTIRLCTGDEDTVRIYNDVLTNKLDNCDVVDDYENEAMEVYLYNPWLTYSLGLHRFREAGLGWGMLEDLDVKTYSFDEIYNFSTDFLVGRRGPKLPHPLDDWGMFIETLSALNDNEKPQYHPIKNDMAPWINIHKLEAMYHQKRKHRSRGVRTETESNDPTSRDDDLTLEEYLHRWAYRPTDYKKLKTLPDLLVTLPDTFPPTNSKVEAHEYFHKWKDFSEEAFEESRDELNELLRRAMKKVKLFVHPDKLPPDLTENQSKLFKVLWEVFMSLEKKWVK